MPFDGRWANELETAPWEHPMYLPGSRWSVDLFGAENAAVTPRIQGAEKLIIRYRSNTPCGTFVGVNIYVDGAYVGYTSYGHLVEVSVVVGTEVSPRTTIGRLATFGAGDEVNWPTSCWDVGNRNGIHTHFEAVDGDACYIPLVKGNYYELGRPIGRIGPSEPAGIRQSCGTGKATATTVVRGSLTPEPTFAGVRADATIRDVGDGVWDGQLTASHLPPGEYGWATVEPTDTDGDGVPNYSAWYVVCTFRPSAGGSGGCRGNPYHTRPLAAGQVVELDQLDRLQDGSYYITRVATGTLR